MGGGEGRLARAGEGCLISGGGDFLGGGRLCMARFETSSSLPLPAGLLWLFFFSTPEVPRNSFTSISSLARAMVASKFGGGWRRYVLISSRFLSLSNPAMKATLATSS